jgi:hypothetical protein
MAGIPRARTGRIAIVTPLIAAAALTGCGIAAHPVAAPPGSAPRPGAPLGNGRIDDPRTKHLACMRAAHLPAVDVGQTDIEVGAPPQGPAIHFTPTPGAAQAQQIRGTVQSAEVIGAALLYPNGGSDAELATIENCLAQGVQG